jgi:glycerol-3-phosphate dehydrogenase
MSSATETSKKPVIVIGAGVVGCSIAYALAHRKVNVLVLDKAPIFGEGASGHNSGVVHSGFNYPKHMLKAKLNREGNELMYDMCIALGVRCHMTGTFVIAQDEGEITHLEALKKQAEDNGVLNTRILGNKQLHFYEPHLAGVGAFLSPRGGIVDAIGLTTAFARVARDKGAEIRFSHEVTGINAKDRSGGFKITTNHGEIEASAIINSAGVHSDEVAQMAGAAGYKIHPCRGEYAEIVAPQDNLLHAMAYPVPVKHAPGLGVHLTRTIDNTILIGPSAKYIEEKEDLTSGRDDIDFFFKPAQKFLPKLQRENVRLGTAGIRAKITPETAPADGDFIIEHDKVPGMINLIGIESPGLTASPAIGKYVADLLLSK